MNYPRIVLAAVAALIAFFAWGFLTEGWLLRNDFAASAALYRASDLQVRYMPFGFASVLVALLAAAVIYARWCGVTSGAASGLQFGFLVGVLVACIHPISNLITMKSEPRLWSVFCFGGAPSDRMSIGVNACLQQSSAEPIGSDETSRPK